MTWVLLILGAAIGGFVNGLAGFGTAMFALSFWLQVLPPAQAVAVVVMVSTVTGLQGIWLVRHAILDHPRRLARFLLPALVGIPLGVMALSWLEPRGLRLTIAVVMLAYGGFFSLRRTLPALDRPTPLIDALVGFVGGVMGGAASLSGVVPTMWCAMRPWPKAETRAVLQPFNVTVLALTAATFALRGAYTPDTFVLIAVALPVSILSAQAGITAFRHLPDPLFRRLIIGLMLVSGGALLLREAF